MFKADSLNVINHSYIYWKNNNVSIISVTIVLLNTHIFTLSITSFFCCIKYILQLLFDNKYQSFLLYYKSKNINSILLLLYLTRIVIYSS
jgi:hypothetical protein